LLITQNNVRKRESAHPLKNFLNQIRIHAGMSEENNKGTLEDCLKDGKPKYAMSIGGYVVCLKSEIFYTTNIRKLAAKKKGELRCPYLGCLSNFVVEPDIDEDGDVIEKGVAYLECKYKESIFKKLRKIFLRKNND